MKIMTTFIILLVPIVIGISSCKKNKTYCWQLIDAFGNEMYSVCDKTEAEMKASYPNPCNYYKLESTDYCWYVDGHIFIKNKPEDYINHMLQCFGFSSATKVACDYCQTWYTRQKNIYKPNNTFSYSTVRSQQYCGDTVRTLFQGREVVLRETADSLIKMQFSNNGIF